MVKYIIIIEKNFQALVLRLSVSYLSSKNFIVGDFFSYLELNYYRKKFGFQQILQIVL